jgi:hypothetical protein
VFEKFLQNENADEKQKVTAVVYRGKKAMQLPTDSSFIFSFPVTLQWKPEQKNIPYKLHIRLNRDSIDTIIRNQNTFLLTEQLFKTDSSAALLAWHATPSDSKATVSAFLVIIPASADKEIIEQQLKQQLTVKTPQCCVYSKGICLNDGWNCTSFGNLLVRLRQHFAENRGDLFKVGAFIKKMLCAQFHTFFAITFKRMVSDHNHPAITIALFNIVEDIDAAFAREINIQHGNLRIQFVNESCSIVIIRSCVKFCGNKIF